MEPITLTVGTIAALAFTKFIESGAGEAAKQLTPRLLAKIGRLREKIQNKLRGIPEADAIDEALKRGEKVTDQQIKLLTPLLETAMKTDDSFAQEVQKIANEIHQDINIGEILGENVQNVYGGAAVQINDPQAPIFTGDISGGSFNFTTNNY